ncbi:ATP-binding protein [Rhodococcus sp. IEGM 1379]|uniref:ATP-binding protein n=1 Tax=Rhodococcus sp. IEGM 1379 TaxID=3047086 RepID=UPI0024B74556|nr:ATP-binding protein [Rhodococcus sp. IEGM 1379]MDI9915178.1 ATP-binding protein [Rhodococcus sp. IEGM 1379]
MKNDAHTKTAWWSISEWRLGWKVVAVLTVPMLIAVMLGAFRIQAELAEAAKLSSSSERALAVPAALHLEDALYELAVASSSGTETTTATAAVTNSMQELVTAGRTFQTDDALNGQVTRALQNSRSIVEEVASGAVAPARLVARVNEVSTDISSAFTDIIKASQRPILREHGGEFATLWAARRALADQRILFGSGRLDQQARTALATTAGAELAALGGVLPTNEADSNPTAVNAVKALTASAQNRVDEIGATASTSPLSSQIDIGLQTSSDQYNALTDAAVGQFGSTVTTEANIARSAALRDTALVLGAVLAALVIALIISRSLVDPIRRLRFAALQAARRGLPEAIERIRAGEKTTDLEFTRVPIRTHEEIGQLARAVDDMHAQAIMLAGEQATLRRQVNDMFETLSRRNKSLVEQQLGLIEQLEQDEGDPRRLENLFRIDHIAARMRRNSDNLLILSGTEGRRGRSAPMSLADALRASVSGVEDYLRVELGQIPAGVLTGQSSADVVHLIAELLDNALRYSPPETTVTINAGPTSEGSMLVEVADLGIGMSTTDLLDANGRLASGGEMSPDTARHMGLFVISRISRRYNISVRLRPTGVAQDRNGITASVLLPAGLLEAPGQDSARTPSAPFIAPARTGAPAATPARAVVPAVTAQVTPVQVSAPLNSNPLKTEATPLSATGLPQRQPGNTIRVTLPPPVAGAPTLAVVALPEEAALPRRTPGTSGAPGIGDTIAEVPTSVAPATESVAPQTKSNEVNSGEPKNGEPEPRHRLSSPTPTNTAAFFSSRASDGFPPRAAVRTTELPDPAPGTTPIASPIFARMVSEWLVDPTEQTSTATSGTAWTTDADQGWVAARASFELPVAKVSDSGLPIRDRGARLVPGTAGTTITPLRSGAHRQTTDPENVRRGWSDYQSGVSRGRRHVGENPADLSTVRHGATHPHSATTGQNDEGEQ